jgi:hypothetical protein
MNDLRKITKMMTTGRVASKEAVMIRSHWGRNPAPPSKDPIPRVRGKFSGLRITTRGQSRSFHASREKRMARVARAGLTRGTTTRKNTEPKRILR